MSATPLAPPGRQDGSLGITDEEFDHDRAGVLARLRAEGDLDFGPAVLDPAHIGDIRGSLGTISLRDRAPRRTWRWRLVTFAAILGPGIIVMTGDNDAGGVQTYTQAGQQYGTSMLWILAALLVVIPLFFLARPQAGPIVRGTLIPGVQGGITGSAILLIVAIVGTTVAPWQLFFQQSNILDKRISPRWLAYERADTFVGVILTTVFGGMMICVAAFALNGTRQYGPNASYADSGWFNDAIRATLGSTAGALAAIMLLVAAVLGAGAVSLSTSYAFGDSFGRKHSLHRTIRTAPVFYLAYGAQIAAASLVVLLAGSTVLGTLTQWVQVLAGILLPSAILFLVLLCNDKAILGPWVNKTWQNVIDFTIIGVLIVLSMILVVNTLFKSVNGVVLTEALFAAAAGAVLVVGVPLIARSRRRRIAAGGSADRLADVRHLDRRTWRMPPLDQLPTPVISPLRKAGLLLLRAYLIASVLLITVKIFSSFIH
jgi:Mn2+/Fe2+ NRAMP family transporter